MKHRLFKLALFLILGAVVNVAVAWGLILWMPITGYEGALPITQWPISVPKGWPPPNDDNRVWGYGWDMVNPRSYIPNIKSDMENPGIIRFLTSSADLPKEIYSLGLWTAGLPTRSMRAEHRFANAPWEWRWAWHKPAKLNWMHAQRDRLLPLRPIWPGFAINTILYAAVLWLLTLGPFTARRMIRRKRGHCIKCGYDLRGTASDAGCPECGWGRESEA